LYTSVPPTNKRNAPASAADNGTSFSEPIKIAAIQINKVLLVSIVDLYGAEAYLVTATPVALKHAIDTMIPHDCKIMIGWAFIY
jgi:hypothetical protein